MPYIGNKYEIGDHNNSWKTLDDISSYVATFDGSATNAVSTTNNTIRVPEHRFIQGQRVTYSNGGGGNIGGLTSGTAYYIIHDTNNEFKLATSLVNANNSTAINLSAVGSGTSHTVTAAFDGVNKKFKITYSGGKSSRFTSATQLSVAINNILQRPNDTETFTDGFRISDNEKIEFNVAPVAADIFWGSILSASLPTFDISDNNVDNFTGDGSTTDFTLSNIPANSQSIIVTVNGVVQHPTDKNGTRAYSLDASVLVFTAAPANGDEIQVRHIGFAGATSSSVTGFYGRTGNVTLSSSADNAIVGVITATKFSGPIVGTDLVGTGLTLTSTDAGSSAGPELKLYRDSASPADADYIGQLKFAGESDTGVERNYAKITGKILDASNGTEDGILEFAHIKAGSQTITGRWRSDSLQLLNGTNFSVAGTSDFTGNATFSGNVSVAGVLTYEDVTNVDSVGIITARGGIFIDDSITHIGDTNTKIRFPSNDTITAETSGSERLRIESGGDVGIGTDNPHKRFHVADYGSHGAIRVEGSGNGNRSGIEFYRETSAGVSKGGAAIWVESDTSSSTGKLRFGTASNAAIQSQGTDMILDQNGNLGIGTDTPIGKLHLNYNGNNGVSFRMENYEGYSTLHNDGGTFHYDSGSHLFRSEDGSNDYLRIQSNGNTIVTSGTQYMGYKLFKANGNTVAELVGFAGDNDTGGLTLWSGNTKLVQLLASNNSYFNGGSIGIGTASPATKLHLQDGDFTIKSSGECGPYLYRNNSNGPDLVFHSGGGSSFSSPTASGDTNLVGNINFAGYDGSSYQRRATINGVVDGSVSSNTVPTALMFRTGTTSAIERLRIDSSGNICGNGGTINLKHPTGSGNVTVNMIGTSGDARLDLENTGNGNYSGIDFVRERASGTGVVGGAIFMKSDTSNNLAHLYIQAQSASAQSPVTSALAANNGVRLLLEGGTGKFGISNGDTERFIINAAGKCHIGLPATTSSWDTNSISLTTNSATFACPATVAIFGGTGFGTANMAGGGIRFVGYYDANNFTTFAHVAGVKENTTSGDYGGALTFHTRANGGLGAETLRITSAGKVIIRSSGATLSDGYAALEIRQNTGGKHLVLATNSATSSTNEVMLGFKLHPSGQDERVKAAIICRGTGSSDYGQPSFMSFCLDNVGDNGNATVANDEKLRLHSSGQLAGMGPDGGVPKIINDADVNLGGRYIWNRLQSSNYVTTSASDQFKIAFWRNTADGHVTCYYRGVSVRVYAGGRTDWSGHGYVTHSSEVLLTMSSTTNGRSHVVSNQGFSYLQNNSSNMRFTGTSWSYDSNYLYATFRFDTNEGGTGWRPYYNIEIIDNDGIVQSVVGV